MRTGILQAVWAAAAIALAGMAPVGAYSAGFVPPAGAQWLLTQRGPASSPWRAAATARWAPAQAGRLPARPMRLTMSTDVETDARLLGSRRLAAAGSVIKKGAGEDDSKKLLFSRRLAKATSIVLRTPRDKKRMLGSKRLREARMILFDKAMQTKPAADEETKLLGSKRLHLVRKVLTQGATEMKSSVAAAESTLSKEASAPAAMKAETTVSDEKTELGASIKEGINYCGQVPTENQVQSIATIRSYLSEMSDEDMSKCSPWIEDLDDVDIYRYLLGFGDAASAWQKIKATAQWRKAENIDSILSEDMSGIFEEGKEEMIYLPPDKKGRPMLLYRWAP